MVVLYHWDMPQVLQDAYGGLLSENFIADFEYFADTAFRLFGDRCAVFCSCSCSMHPTR